MSSRSGGSERRAATGLLWLTFCIVLAAPAFAQQARRIDAKLDQPPFNRNLWGVALMDEGGRLLYGRNADRMFIPASNTKIIVAAVASALLPPDWTVNTSLYATGPVVDGVLRGDLILYGRGDPTFSKRCYGTDSTVAGACDTDPFAQLRQLAQGLKARGVVTVAGDLVGDGSYFEPKLVLGDWSSYDVSWWYAAPVSGLGFNDNSVTILWGPGNATGAPAVLSLTPDLGDLSLENRARTVLPDSATTIDFYRREGTLTIWAEGDVAFDNRGGDEDFAMPDPNLFTARALRQVLAEEGIAVLGTTGSTTDSLAYAQARATAPLAEVSSRPLKDWIFPILNTSQNWFAEMMLKQLGRRFGTAGSWAEGIKVETRFLIDSVKADSTQFALSDASGLSASDLVSPETFARVLRFIRRHPRYATFAAGLPQSGNTGSLKNRFLGTPLEGLVRAKTGSISRVNTLSGYIERKNGRVLIFSIQANNHQLKSKDILPRMDSVVVEMGR